MLPLLSFLRRLPLLLNKFAFASIGCTSSDTNKFVSEFGLHNCCSFFWTSSFLADCGSASRKPCVVQYVKDRVQLLCCDSGEYRGRTDDLLHAMQAL